MVDLQTFNLKKVKTKMKFTKSKLIYMPLLTGLLFSCQVMAENSNAKTAVGGGLGAAAGTAIGGIVGGNTGEVVGGAVGGGVGAGVTTKGKGQTGAIVGGAAGGAGGAYVGRQVSGSGTGAVVGAGLGGAGGSVLGKVVTEPRVNKGTTFNRGTKEQYYGDDNRKHYKHKHKHGNGYAYGHDKHGD